MIGHQIKEKYWRRRTISISVSFSNSGAGVDSKSDSGRCCRFLRRTTTSHGPSSVSEGAESGSKFREVGVVATVGEGGGDGGEGVTVDTGAGAVTGLDIIRARGRGRGTGIKAGVDGSSSTGDGSLVVEDPRITMGMMSGTTMATAGEFSVSDLSIGETLLPSLASLKGSLTEHPTAVATPCISNPAKRRERNISVPSKNSEPPSLRTIVSRKLMVRCERVSLIKCLAAYAMIKRT